MYNKNYGQNFLINKNKINEIINILKKEININDNIIEIGPGDGVLTFEILKLNNNLKIIEIDQRLIFNLLQKNSNLNIIHNDCLKENLNSDIIITNLPYNISNDFLIKLCIETQFKSAFIMLQKEVVDRIICKTGKNFGLLSLIIQKCMDCKVLLQLSCYDFFPAPKVYSTFIELKWKCNISKKEFLFYKLLFNNRRKKIGNIIKYNDIYKDKRIDELNINQITEIYNIYVLN